MGFSDAFQSHHHYQNSSFKTSPAQRDASSRNAELYEAARSGQQAASRSAGNRDRQNLVTGSKGSGGSDNLTADQSQADPAADLPDFDFDARGNVYLSGNRGSKGSGLLQKAKGLFKSKTMDDTDVVR